MYACQCHVSFKIQSYRDRYLWYQYIMQTYTNIYTLRICCMYRWMIYNLQSTYTKHTSTNAFYSNIVHFPPTISFQERGLRLAMFESLEKGMRKARRGVKRKESTCTTGRNTEFCGCKVMWWNDRLIFWIMLDSSEVASLLPNGCRKPDESWDSFYISWFAGFFPGTVLEDDR